jgi:hypothetical protein
LVKCPGFFMSEKFEKHRSRRRGWDFGRRHSDRLQQAISYSRDDVRMKITKKIVRIPVVKLEESTKIGDPNSRWTWMKLAAMNEQAKNFGGYSPCVTSNRWTVNFRPREEKNWSIASQRYKWRAGRSRDCLWYTERALRVLFKRRCGKMVRIS